MESMLFFMLHLRRSHWFDGWMDMKSLITWFLNADISPKKELTLSRAWMFVLHSFLVQKKQKNVPDCESSLEEFCEGNQTNQGGMEKIETRPSQRAQTKAKNSRKKEKSGRAYLARGRSDLCKASGYDVGRNTGNLSLRLLSWPTNWHQRFGVGKCLA